MRLLRKVLLVTMLLVKHCVARCNIDKLSEIISEREFVMSTSDSCNSCVTEILVGLLRWVKMISSIVTTINF